MSLIAEFHLASPSLPMSDSLAAVPEMTLDVEQAVADDPTRPILFLWASGDDFDAFEQAMAEDDTINPPELIEDVGDRRLYRVQISADAEVVIYPTDVEVGASRLAVSATHRGLDVRMRFPSREALREYFSICRDMGVSVTLNGVYHSDGDEHSPEYGLSPKQRESLEAALRAGYYEVPRTADLEGVACELDVSPQATSERLRRGTALLIEHALGVEY